MGISVYLHRDQLHVPSADFLWPRTTEVASAALPVQFSLLRACVANTSAIHKDIFLVAQSNSTRDTAHLN